MMFRTKHFALLENITFCYFSPENCTEIKTLPETVCFHEAAFHNRKLLREVFNHLYNYPCGQSW